MICDVIAGGLGKESLMPYPINQRAHQFNSIQSVPVSSGLWDTALKFLSPGHRSDVTDHLGVVLLIGRVGREICFNYYGNNCISLNSLNHCIRHTSRCFSPSAIAGACHVQTCHYSVDVFMVNKLYHCLHIHIKFIVPTIKIPGRTQGLAS